MSDRNIRERDFHVETIAPHIAAALKESEIEAVGADDPAFWAQGLEPLRLGMEAVRQAQRNADPEARRAILDSPALDREIDRLRVAARALELLRDDARQALGVAGDDEPQRAEPGASRVTVRGAQVDTPVTVRGARPVGPGPTAETDAEDEQR